MKKVDLHTVKIAASGAVMILNYNSSYFHKHLYRNVYEGKGSFHFCVHYVAVVFLKLGDTPVRQSRISAYGLEPPPLFVSLVQINFGLFFL